MKNELVARTQEPIPDRELETRLKDALIFDPITEAHEIFVTVKNGNVKLTGTVGTFFESAEAFDVASRLAGVTKVDDELKVREPAVPYVYSAYLDPFTPDVETWYVISPRATETDADIRSHVQAEFSWSPTFRERQAAAQSAFEAGAVAVDNEIKVG